ncbi:hypothetical protein [Levilactobacillus andaensis]|uniref:hypothetical protein n=1 Tax=Levilactobacillus andaensis TaxID=2799570 RepID=UPI00194263CF|nr:hypothetical protein [Levilactobacillus andaensis]
MIPETGKIFTLKADNSIFIMVDDRSSTKKVTPLVFMRPEGFWMNLTPRGKSNFWHRQLSKGFEYLSVEQLAKRAADEHWADNLGNLLEEF